MPDEISELTQTMRTGEKRGSLLWVLDLDSALPWGRESSKALLRQPLTNNAAIINKKAQRSRMNCTREGVLRQEID